MANHKSEKERLQWSQLMTTHYSSLHFDAKSKASLLLKVVASGVRLPVADITIGVKEVSLISLILWP